MTDKIAFMETLHSVQEIARTSLTPMSKEEIGTYFKEMDLTKEQEEMVYQYLLHPQEDTQAEEADGEQQEESREEEPEEAGEKKAGEKEAEEKEAEEKRNIRSSAYFRMYLDEIKEIPVLSAEKQGELYRMLQRGDLSVREDISKQWLERVIGIAAEYASGDVVLDDLVQEGNIGLLTGLNQLSGDTGEQKEGQQIEEMLCGFIREAISAYLEEETGEDNQENTILAKVSLLHEARQELAQKSGSEPSLKELSEYTRIPEEEAADILSLAREVKGKA